MQKKFSFFCSWSGGKDSALALYNVIQMGGEPKFLLNMLREDGKRSRSHGLTFDTLQKQAQALGIPLLTRSTSWDDYEAHFISALEELKKKGIEVGVFGDIDIEEHREWVERVCSYVKIKPLLPLWKKTRIELLKELLDLGFKATIIVVKDDKLSKNFLGRTLNKEVIAELEKVGIDLSGESGEYHTIVTAGPIFSHPINLNKKKVSSHNGYSFLDISVL
ncbi:MAG: diphthine--ammonia ligase [Promethearchaeota archaeon]